MSLSDLPEEIAFKISEYGQILPLLDLQYIVDEVRVLDPNFSWYSELMIHYLRKVDVFYNVMIIPGKLRLTYDSIILEADDPISDDITNLLYNNNIECTIEVNKLIIYNVSQEQLINSSSLIDVRSKFLISRDPAIDTIITSKTEQHRSHEGRHSIDNRGVSMRDDYLLMIENTTLPRELGLDSPSDVEILEIILELDPKFNVGELLHWLRTRSEVIKALKDNTFKSGDEGIDRWIHVAHDLITEGTMIEYIIMSMEDFDDIIGLDCIDNEACLRVIERYGLCDDVIESFGESSTQDPLNIVHSSHWNDIARAFTYLKPIFMRTNNRIHGIMWSIYLE
uniref:Uncharacterized protein n=1 Tax=viral metagenome TaxID=1070528 RepID=A0A6C0BL26_9ZZZZ